MNDKAIGLQKVRMKRHTARKSAPGGLNNKRIKLSISDSTTAELVRKLKITFGPDSRLNKLKQQHRSKNDSWQIEHRNKSESEVSTENIRDDTLINSDHTDSDSEEISSVEFPLCTQTIQDLHDKSKMPSPMPSDTERDSHDTTSTSTRPRFDDACMKSISPRFGDDMSITPSNQDDDKSVSLTLSHDGMPTSPRPSLDDACMKPTPRLILDDVCMKSTSPRPSPDDHIRSVTPRHLDDNDKSVSLTLSHDDMSTSPKPSHDAHMKSPRPSFEINMKSTSSSCTLDGDKPTSPKPCRDNGMSISPRPILNASVKSASPKPSRNDHKMSTSPRSSVDESVKSTSPRPDFDASRKSATLQSDVNHERTPSSHAHMVLPQLINKLKLSLSKPFSALPRKKFPIKMNSVSVNEEEENIALIKPQEPLTEACPSSMNMSPSNTTGAKGDYGSTSTIAAQEKNISDENSTDGNMLIANGQDNHSTPCDVSSTSSPMKTQCKNDSDFFLKSNRQEETDILGVPDVSCVEKSSSLHSTINSSADHMAIMHSECEESLEKSEQKDSSEKQTIEESADRVIDNMAKSPTKMADMTSDKTEWSCIKISSTSEELVKIHLKKKAKVTSNDASAQQPHTQLDKDNKDKVKRKPGRPRKVPVGKSNAVNRATYCLHQGTIPYSSPSMNVKKPGRPKKVACSCCEGYKPKPAVQKKPGRPRRQSAITDNAVTPDEPDACTNTFSTENCDSHQNADSCRAQQAENISREPELPQVAVASDDQARTPTVPNLMIISRSIEGQNTSDSTDKEMKQGKASVSDPVKQKSPQVYDFDQDKNNFFQKRKPKSCPKLDTLMYSEAYGMVTIRGSKYPFVQRQGEQFIPFYDVMEKYGKSNKIQMKLLEKRLATKEEKLCLRKMRPYLKLQYFGDVSLVRSSHVVQCLKRRRRNKKQGVTPDVSSDNGELKITVIHKAKTAEKENGKEGNDKATDDNLKDISQGQDTPQVCRQSQDDLRLFESRMIDKEDLRYSGQDESLSHGLNDNNRKERSPSEQSSGNRSIVANAIHSSIGINHETPKHVPHSNDETRDSIDLSLSCYDIETSFLEDIISEAASKGSPSREESVIKDVTLGQNNTDTNNDAESVERVNACDNELNVSSNSTSSETLSATSSNFITNFGDQLQISDDGIASHDISNIKITNVCTSTAEEGFDNCNITTEQTQITEEAMDVDGAVVCIDVMEMQAAYKVVENIKTEQSPDRNESVIKNGSPSIIINENRHISKLTSIVRSSDNVGQLIPNDSDSHIPPSISGCDPSQQSSDFVSPSQGPSQNNRTSGMKSPLLNHMLKSAGNSTSTSQKTVIEANPCYLNESLIQRTISPMQCSPNYQQQQLIRSSKSQCIPKTSSNSHSAQNTSSYSQCAKDTSLYSQCVLNTGTQLTVSQDVVDPLSQRAVNVTNNQVLYDQSSGNLDLRSELQRQVNLANKARKSPKKPSRRKKTPTRNPSYPRFIPDKKASPGGRRQRPQNPAAHTGPKRGPNRNKKPAPAIHTNPGISQGQDTIHQELQNPPVNTQQRYTIRRILQEQDMTQQRQQYPAMSATSSISPEQDRTTAYVRHDPPAKTNTKNRQQPGPNAKGELGRYFDYLQQSHNLQTNIFYNLHKTIINQKVEIDLEKQKANHYEEKYKETLAELTALKALHGYGTPLSEQLYAQQW